MVTFKPSKNKLLNRAEGGGGGHGFRNPHVEGFPFLTLTRGGDEGFFTTTKNLGLDGKISRVISAIRREIGTGHDRQWKILITAMTTVNAGIY